VTEDTVTLETYRWSGDPTEKDANFKAQMAQYTLNDPMPTIETMSRNLKIPVGAIVKYVLVKWAVSGTETLMELGPIAARQMAEAVKEAEAAGTDEARLASYHKLRRIVSWLNVPLTDPKWKPGRREAQ